MSKAFTRESDDAPEEPSPVRPVSTLPPGAKNYLTADGARRLRQEVERLTQIERPQAAHLPDPDAARRRGQLLDQRIAALHESLRSAVVVSPPAGPEDKAGRGVAMDGALAHEPREGRRIAGVGLAPPGERLDRKSTRLNSSHGGISRMPSSA